MIDTCDGYNVIGTENIKSGEKRPGKKLGLALCNSRLSVK